jgi:hypothetical protein
MGKLNDYIKKIYEEEESDEELDETDAASSAYGVEYRDMQSSIHHLFICNTEEKATQLFDILLGIKELQDEGVEENEEAIDDAWSRLDEFTHDDIEINFRNIETKEELKYYNHRGEEILIINDYVIDIYP